MKLSDIRFPFTVKRVTTGQDGNGDPVETTTQWSSKCAYKEITSKQMLIAGQDTTTERAVITFYALPERKIALQDIITLRGKDWNPEGDCSQVEEGRMTFYRQMIKHG